MEAVSGWVLSIVGVVVLTTIIEIIMPNGSINKFIKGIFVLFTIFIMISPITRINIGSLFGVNTPNLNLDEEYIEDVNMKKLEEYKILIKDSLSGQGYKNISLDIHGKTLNGELKINTIFVDLCNLVLNNEALNINKYEHIKKIIIKIVDVAEEDIIFYE